MNSRGRKPGFRMSEDHRLKIQNSNILTALIQHVEGTREMSASQVTAGLGLLRKTLPDLCSIEHFGQVDINPRDMSDNELAAIAARGIQRTPAPKADTSKLN